jgi:hypothetical protein
LRDFLILIPIFNRDFFVAVRCPISIKNWSFSLLLAYKIPYPSV